MQIQFGLSVLCTQIQLIVIFTLHRLKAQCDYMIRELAL